MYKYNFTIAQGALYENTKNIGSTDVQYCRTSDFSKMMLEIKDMLLKTVGATDKYKLIVLTGSGSIGMESAVYNFTVDKDYGVVLNNKGVFGNRFKEMLSRCRDTMHNNAIKSVIFTQLCETSTDELIDLKSLNKTSDDLLVVDAISAYGCDNINVVTDDIDVLIFSSQKFLSLPPGLSFIILSTKAQDYLNKNIDKLKTIPMYYDYSIYMQNMERGQTPFTPATGIVNMLYDRLLLMNFTNEHNGIAERAKTFRNLLEDSELSKDFYIPTNMQISNCCTPLYKKSGSKINLIDFVNYLHDEHNIDICSSGGSLSDTLIRIGHIGNQPSINVIFNKINKAFIEYKKVNND